MSRTATSIKFRYLAHQLNNTEYDQFLSTFCNEILVALDRECILTLLFNLFTSKLPSNISYNQIENTNQIISKIIQSRQTQPDDDDTNASMSIDELPFQLVGEISSYLNYKNHHEFSQSNRAIFIGSNMPNTVQKLDFCRNRIKNNYSKLKLEHYKSLKFLSFNLNQLNQFPIPSTSITPRLNELQLYGSRNADLFCRFPINMSNLKIFHLKFYGRDDAISVSKLLTKIRNIEVLNLIRIKCDQLPQEPKLKKSLSNLKKLVMFNCATNITNQMINLFGNNLHHFVFSNLDGSIAANITFPNLLSLQIVPLQNDIHLTAVCTVLIRANVLKKIGINFEKYSDYNSEIANVTSLACSKPLLKRIDIQIDSKHLTFVCDGIKQAIETQLIEIT